MISLRQLVEEFFDGENTPEALVFPEIPGKHQLYGNTQPLEDDYVSRASRISRSETDDDYKNDQTRRCALDPHHPRREVRARSEISKTSGNPGNPGKAPVTHCLPSFSSFPLEEIETGNAGKSEGEPAGVSQRPPISPDEVRALFERTLNDLEQRFPYREARFTRALSLVASKLHNDPRLSSPQINASCCWICGKPEGDMSFIAVLSTRPGRHYWMHSDCHGEHRRRVEQTVVACLRNANIGVGHPVRQHLDE